MHKTNERKIQRNQLQAKRHVHSHRTGTGRSEKIHSPQSTYDEMNEPHTHTHTHKTRTHSALCKCPLQCPTPAAPVRLPPASCRLRSALLLSFQFSVERQLPEMQHISQTTDCRLQTAAAEPRTDDCCQGLRRCVLLHSLPHSAAAAVTAHCTVVQSWTIG